MEKDEGILNLYRRFWSHCTFRNVLVIYFLCASLMLSLAFIGGPDPRLKVYVIASQSTIAKVEDIARRNSPAYGTVTISVFTLADEENEINTLTLTGSLDAVVIGDFPSPGEDRAPYIYSALDYVPKKRLLVLEEYASSGLARDVSNRYWGKIQVVTLDPTIHFARGVGLLEKILLNLCKDKYILLQDRIIFLRLNFDQFSLFAATTAILSLTLILLGVALLVIRAIEVEASGGVIEFLNVLIMAFFVFVFTQILFITCSSMIAMPIGLHGNFSPRHVTAVSFISPAKEYGGSLLRFIFGLGGYVFGAMATISRGKIKLDVKTTVVITVLIISLIFITSRIYVTSFPALRSLSLTPRGRTPVSLLDFILGPSGILYFLPNYFGAYVTHIAFFGNRSIYLFFAGSMCLPFLHKTRRIVKSTVFLICIILIARGTIALGNIMPLQTYASIVSGVIFGFFLIFIVGGLNAVEGICEKALSKAKSNLS